MKFGRFLVNNRVTSGVLAKGVVKEIEGNIFESWSYTGHSFKESEVTILAPLEPNHIIGIGANYVARREDLPEVQPEIPVFFFKPTSSVIGPEELIIIPHGLNEVKFEAELAVVIGKKAKNIPEADILDYVFGYTVGNDVTAPQFFHQDGHWMVGKAFDTFTPIGPVIETELNPLEVRIESRVNEEEKQNSGTELLIVPIRRILSYLSYVMTLNPGDVILTGSPVGAEMVKSGDLIECEIKEIGSLRNRFEKEVKTALSL
jgi:2-keto-4-pentenoate hydratase/2-oxohepta-3-ene-1,7-dioic acid hydratase in catechol pathway